MAGKTEINFTTLSHGDSRSDTGIPLMRNENLREDELRSAARQINSKADFPERSGS